MQRITPGLMSRKNLLSTAFFAVMTWPFAILSCSIAQDPADASTSIVESAKKRPRGYFFSIDGLQPRLLESFTSLDSATNGGFRSLWRKGLVFPDAKAHVISITAASHASTATCSSPSRHGITGNHFLRNNKKVSGFKEPLRAETMWQAARRQGRKVASFAYVAVDGGSPERSADLGITYPDDARMGKSAIVSLKDANGIPFELDTVLDPKRDVRVKLSFIPEVAGSRVRPHVVFTTPSGLRKSVELPGGRSGHSHTSLFIHDGERLRRILIQAIASKEDHFLVSRASYNEAHPESFRKSLDDSGLVWPDVNIKGMNLDLRPDEAVGMQGILDDFITDVAARSINQHDPDVVLFYQPLIDSTGHGFQNKLPDSGSLAGKDPVSSAFLQAFRRVDSNIARVLATSRPRDFVALMGDHGMVTTTDNVNVAPLLPDGIDKAVDVYASDSMLYLYPAAGNSDSGAVKRAGEKLRDILAPLARNGKNVVEMVAEKDPAKGSLWNYGDAAWAFRSSEGFWFVNNPLEKDIFLPPKVPGMHGHNPDFKSMHTTLIFTGPSIKPAIRRDQTVSLVDAVPTFASLIDLAPPADCEGKSLL
jgi:predicted AlkP superfamily pyrophosphatase or phosphodiesterase